MAYTKKITKIDSNEISIEVELDQTSIAEAKNEAYKKLAKDVKIPGFRPGKAPRAMIEARIGVTMYDEILNILLPNTTIEILESEDVQVIAPIQYDIKEFNPEEKVTYTATCFIFPEFKLPDMSKLKVKKDEIEMKDEEVMTQLNSFISNLDKTAKKKELGTKNEEQDKSDESKNIEATFDSIDDEWIKAKNIPNINSKTDLKEYFEKSIKESKEKTTEQKYINDMLEEAANKADIKISDKLIDMEVKAREKQDQERLESLGINWEDWQKQQKDELEKQREELEKQVKLSLQIQFLMAKISEENKFEVDQSKVDAVLATTSTGVIESYGEESIRKTISEQLLQDSIIKWLREQVEK